MVLDKLGESLSDALRKIAGKGFVDKAAVDEFMRDLQRALLQADVDVKLVSKLSNNIRDRALNEKPAPGITVKEHMIKTVYDELVNFLGRETGAVELKKQKILLVGLFGAGKCVHPNSRIPLATGEIKTIEKIYSECGSPETVLEDGFVKEDIQGSHVFSFNPTTLKMEAGKVTHLWKLEKTDPLISVKLDNGNYHEITVTPEHPFFVLDSGKIKIVRADEITVNDKIAAPSTLKFSGKPVDYREHISELGKGFAIIDLQLSNYLRSRMLKEFDTLKEAFQKLGLEGAYCTFTYNLKRGYLGAELLGKCKLYGIDFEFPSFVKILRFGERMTSRPIKFPLVMCPEMGEFLGYVYGDGYINRRYVEITTEDREIIEKVDKLSLYLFGKKPRVKLDYRRKNLFKIQLASSVLVKLLNRIFELPIGKKSDKIRVSKILAFSDNTILKHFIRAYFDCDGHVSNGSRGIELTTSSEQMCYDLRVLLLRFGILSSMSKKIIDNRPYYRFCIRAKNAELFCDLIGSVLPDKMRRLEKFSGIGNGQTYGRHEQLDVGGLLKDVREAFGVSVGELQNHVNSYGTYEREGVISKNSLKKFLHCIKSCGGDMMEVIKTSKNEVSYDDLQAELDVNKPRLNAILFRLEKLGLISSNRGSLLKLKTTEKGVDKLEEVIKFDHIKLGVLEKLANAEMSWIPVKSVAKCDSVKYVYDMTVENYHNFVANEVIVHNTTTSAKLARFFVRRGLKPALVGCDTFRPAAQEQIMQLGNQIGVPVYATGADASKTAEEAIKKFSDRDVIIFDSAGRNALDSELADELKKLKDSVKPDQIFLVIPAEIGQAAGTQSEEFAKLVGITGLIVTKMDGTAKGGAALSSCAIVNAPIKFIGVGEKVDEFEQYDPKRFVSRLIGYGDLQGLVERAEEIKSPELMKSAENMMSGKYSLGDFYEQIESIKKMGPLKQVMQMIPGLKMPDGMLDVQEKQMEKWKVAMDSMTKKEKQDPSIMDNNRIKRIASGSGLKEDDVKELIKHYDRTKKMMKMMGGKNLKRGGFAQLAKQFGMKM